MHYVHAADGERLKLVKSGDGGIDGAYELGAPGGEESILWELSLGDGVNLHGAEKSMVGVRSKGLEPRRGCVVVGDENGRLAIGE
ncbi:plastidial pyruvate kinase 1 [Pyrus ussuriensis x Pyrus communis]|uniref:Plastidial pyruvate kinase 1 n=1 Tax=Pyrus ussuriensis x Pyrus communis TaxID=2448454 RepID=A0A5N5GCS2_9ROSA|nr:plastidial pyruvate kinase 1 [Pyrus ussuriensis x Pyrus communis]